jgi:transposase-like protein
MTGDMGHVAILEQFLVSMTERSGAAAVFLGRIKRSMEALMPLPYSADLRERVLVAYEHGEGTAAALARRFRVALNTVKNWVRAAE